MEERFNKIKNVRFEIKDTFAKLTAKKDTVRGYYIQYIEKNKKNKMFGLDSFHFQSKLIDLEYKHLNEHYIFIDNRIYCDYYKLYNILITFYKQNFKTDFKHRNYPIYKDLEPFKQYDFDDINNIHYDIIEMIQHAYALINQNNDEIKLDQQKLRSGFNIDNYIHNNIYKNTLLSTNVNLFENYLHSYHIYHMNFLKSLLDKLGLFQTQLSTNVRTDGVTPSESLSPTPSRRSLDRVISIEDEQEMNIVIDRSPSRPPPEIVRDVHLDNSSSCADIIYINEELSKEISEEPKEDPIEVIDETIKKESEEELIEVISETIKEEIKEEPTEVISETIKEDPIEEVIIEAIKEEPNEEVISEVIKEIEESNEVISKVIKEEPIEVISEVISEVIKEEPIEVISEAIIEELEEREEVIQNNTRGIDPNDVEQSSKKKRKKKR